MKLTDEKNQYLKALEIHTWVLREKTATKNLTQHEAWQCLQTEVKHCTACSLHKTRTQTVFGMGNPTSSLLFVGEGPGANEDLQGLPFVGRAGQLLDAMLASIKLNRDQVYIANIIKCRPPKNRDPSAEEIATCTPFLLRQIDFLKPKLIVALGRIAAHYLLQTQRSMMQLRGKIHSFQPANIPLVVTYHPAYLLRNPLDKAKSWQDLQLIAAYYQS